MEQAGDSHKPGPPVRKQKRLRPIEVKKPNAPYRYPVTSGWILLHTLLAWVVVIAIFAGLYLVVDHTTMGASLIGVGMLIPGILFAGYFVSMGRAGGMALAPLIIIALIGALIPFWGGMFIIVPFGLGTGLLLPVGWLFFVMRAFSYRWIPLLIIAGCASLLFVGWTAILYLTASDTFMFFIEEQLLVMAFVWHLVCSLVCVFGVNERRLAVNKVWREYVRHRPTCPMCRYRFRGLPKSAERCPECGELIPIWVRNPEV